MKYISTKEYAKAHGLAERTVRNYCVQGKITGAQLIGKSWNIPADAPLPDRKMPVCIFAFAKGPKGTKGLQVKRRYISSYSN